MTTTGLFDHRQPARWWLAGNDPDKESVGGLYWVSNNGTPWASWQSALPGGPRSIWSAQNPIEILHGETMGKAITLADVRIASTEHPARGRVSHTEAHAMLAFEGDLLLELEHLQFDRLHVHLRDLPSWAGWLSWQDMDADRPTFPRLEYQGKRRREFTCDSDLLAIEDAASWTQRHGEWTLIDGCRLDLTLDEPAPLDDIQYHWLRSAQLLLASASGRECSIHRLGVSRKEWLRAIDEDSPEIRGRSPWLQVRARGVHVDTADEPLSGFDLLHRLTDLSDDDQLERLVTASRHHRYALERYVRAKSGGAGSLETSFQEAAQAVESLDSALHDDAAADWQDEAVAIVTQALMDKGYNSEQRRAAVRGLRTAHEKSLSARLRRADDEAGKLLSGATSSTSWAEDTQTLRNAVTHGRAGPAFKDIGGALIIAREICLLLFELAWLRVMGYDAETAEHLFRRRASLPSNLDTVSEHTPKLTQAAATVRRSRDA